MSPIDAGRDIAVADRRTLSVNDAVSLAQRLFGIDGRAQRLDGEYDENFRIDASNRSYVLKVAAASERAELVDVQVAALRHLTSGHPERSEGSAVRLTGTEINGT